MSTPEGETPSAPKRPDDATATARFGVEFRAALSALEGVVSSEEQAAINALPADSALLIVRRGPNAGSRFLLDSDTTTVGRHPHADIFLDDVTVSRRHAEFLRQDGVFSVRDLGSLNGTYYNGVRIEDTRIADGAEVQIGKYRLTFYASRAGAAAAE